MAPIRVLEDMERMESIDFKAITAEVARKISNMSLKERTRGWHRSFETNGIRLIDKKCLILKIIGTTQLETWHLRHLTRKLLHM